MKILDIVSQYIKLEQQGSYWVGNCPFHEEKNRFFVVSPNEERFYCFGCHIGGDVDDFISKIKTFSHN